MFDTVATALFDDAQVDWLLTLWVVPFDIVAIDEYWAVSPTEGAVPVTATEVTIGDAGGVAVVDGDVGVDFELLPPHDATIKAPTIRVPCRRISD